MTIQFDIWTWKDIQNVVGTVISFDEAREMLHYIRLRCQDSAFFSKEMEIDTQKDDDDDSDYGSID